MTQLSIYTEASYNKTLRCQLVFYGGCHEIVTALAQCSNTFVAANFIQMVKTMSVGLRMFKQSKHLVFGQLVEFKIRFNKLPTSSFLEHCLDLLLVMLRQISIKHRQSV